jgi:hypothetical protein
LGRTDISPLPRYGEGALHLDGPHRVLLMKASKKHDCIAGRERLTSQTKANQTGIPGTDKNRQVLRFKGGLPLKILY